MNLTWYFQMTQETRLTMAMYCGISSGRHWIRLNLTGYAFTTCGTPSQAFWSLKVKTSNTSKSKLCDHLARNFWMKDKSGSFFLKLPKQLLSQQNLWCCAVWNQTRQELDFQHKFWSDQKSCENIAGEGLDSYRALKVYIDSQNWRGFCNFFKYSNAERDANGKWDIYDNTPKTKFFPIAGVSISNSKPNVVNLRDWFIIHVKFSVRNPMVARVLSPRPYRFYSICKQLK